MATETVLSDHHSPDKTMEKVDEEQGQTMKLEDVDLPNESGGKDEEEKLDADGLAVNKVEETAVMQTKLPASSVEVEKVEDAPVVDVHVEADSGKIGNCAPNSESLSAPGPGDDAIEALSGDPDKQCTVVEKGDNPSLEDLPAEVDMKVVESCVLDPESESAPKLGEMPEEHSVDVQKVDDDVVPVLDTPAETGSKMAENSVLDPESSSASGGEIVERQLEVPEGDTTEVEKVDDAIIADVLAESGSKLVKNSALEPESSPSEPIGAAVERLSEEYPTVVEKADGATVVGVPSEAGLEMVQDSVLNPESSSASKPGVEMVEGQREGLEEHPVEVEKVDNIPVLDSSIEAESSSSSEPGGATVQRQLEATDEHSIAEIFETQRQEKVAAEAIEQPEEKPSADVPVEHLRVIPVKESELEAAKVPEASSEAVCKIAESRGLVTKLEGETGEKAEIIKGVKEETDEIKPSESLRREVMASGRTMADKYKVNEILKEEETSLDQGPVAHENLVPANQEVRIDPKEEKGDSSTSSDVIVKDVAGLVVERLSKDENVVATKVEEGKEEKNEKIEDSEGKSTKIEESVPTETAKTDDRNDSNLVAEVAGIDREQVSRDVEVVAEMKKMENVKEDTPFSGEADKDKDAQVKLSEVDAKETVENHADNLESTKEDSEIAKSDGDNTKTSVKKHSNNLMSKVKQSIVKVKKAIIGKSPSSKALLPEAKKDEKVK